MFWRHSYYVWLILSYKVGSIIIDGFLCMTTLLVCLSRLMEYKFPTDGHQDH